MALGAVRNADRSHWFSQHLRYFVPTVEFLDIKALVVSELLILIDSCYLLMEQNYPCHLLPSFYAVRSMRTKVLQV